MTTPGRAAPSGCPGGLFRRGSTCDRVVDRSTQYSRRHFVQRYKSNRTFVAKRPVPSGSTLRKSKRAGGQAHSVGVGERRRSAASSCRPKPSWHGERGGRTRRQKSSWRASCKNRNDRTTRTQEREGETERTRNYGPQCKKRQNASTTQVLVLCLWGLVVGRRSRARTRSATCTLHTA